MKVVQLQNSNLKLVMTQALGENNGILAQKCKKVPSQQEICWMAAHHCPTRVRVKWLGLVFSGPWSVLCQHAAQNAIKSSDLIEIYVNIIDFMEQMLVAFKCRSS